MKKNAKEGVSFSKTNFILRGSGLFTFNYTKIQELGSGGFSKVFRVQNLLTKEVFACKELPIKKIKDQEKFKNEINIMSKCDHPNIIIVFSGEKGQPTFYKGGWNFNLWILLDEFLLLNFSN